MDKHLSKLTLSKWLQTDVVDDLASARSELLQSLDRQIEQVEEALNDGVFLDMVQAWLRCEDEHIALPVDRFYWKHSTGAWIITLQLNNEVLAASAFQPSIEVGHCEDIPNTLELLKQAVKAGELDQKILRCLNLASQRRRSLRA